MLRATTTILCIILSLSAYSQVEKDTVFVQGRSVLILGDTSVFVFKDTTFVLPDTVAVFLKEDTVRRNRQFYNKIKKTLYKTGLTKELYHLMFDEPTPRARKAEKARVIQDNFREHEGKVISDLKIEKLAIFGTNINDTTQFNQSSKLIRLANRAHNYTRSNIIKNLLVFREGEKVDPVELKDSERILRAQPYIQDARIILVEVDEHLVQAVVIVKDTWSLYPGGQIYDLDRIDFSLIEQNFLGFGHQFTNQIQYDGDDKPQIGYVGSYTVPNVRRTFINLRLDFARSDQYNTQGFELFRNYVTPDIKWAGGIGASYNTIEFRRLAEDSLVVFDSRFRQQDLWISRAFPIGLKEKRKRIVIGSRFVNYNFLTQPEVRPDSNYIFFDREQYLFNVGISRRGYEQHKLIYGYGRTEDIPVGYKFNVTMGKEVNQFYDRFYAGINYAVGGYLRKLGYFRPSVSVGSFMRKGEFEQGIVSGTIDYFSLLYQFNKFAFRQFFHLNLTEGINRFGNEFIDVNDRNGVRGLRSLQLRGTKRLTFSSESLAFTPFYFIGFRMAIFVFADLAFVQVDEKNIFKGDFYQGYGLGFRFRNENLAFKQFLIRFSFYPGYPDDARPLGLDVSGRIAQRPADFDIGQPRILNFN